MEFIIHKSHFFKFKLRHDFQYNFYNYDIIKKRIKILHNG